MFQSTHPHGVRPIGTDNFGRLVVWFQSTHPHGVRRRSDDSGFREGQGFNPRTHTGCDVRIVIDPIPSLCFNPRTHTGCDIVLLFYHNANISFNPRTHTGCDTGLRYSDVYNLRFQSTHPHGVRRCETSVNDYITVKFQSTHPHGVRLLFGLTLGFKICVSIHAPTRGAT